MLAMARWGPLHWLNAVMALALAAAAVLQLNDPDPLPWMALYGGAALACATCGRGRWAIAMAAVVAVCALAWALAIARGIDRLVAVGELVSATEMMDDAIERSREVLGLLIVAGWMTFLVIRQRRGDRAVVRH